MATCWKTAAAGEGLCAPLPLQVPAALHRLHTGAPLLRLRGHQAQEEGLGQPLILLRAGAG